MKKIKFVVFLLASIFALSYSFVNVSAEEHHTRALTSESEQVTDEDEETPIIDENENQNEDEEQEETVDKFDEVKVWLGDNFEALIGTLTGLVSAFGLSFIALIVGLLKTRIKNSKDEEKYQQEKAELLRMHQEELEKANEDFNKKIGTLKDEIIQTIGAKVEEQKVEIQKEIDENTIKANDYVEKIKDVKIDLD